MNSTRRYMPVLAIVFVFFLTGAAAAQNSSASYDGAIKLGNPCNGTTVFVKGTTTVDIHQNVTDDGTSHVAVHMRYDGAGTDLADKHYKVSFEANDGQAQSTPDGYFLPFHSVWVGEGSAPNFKMDGTVLIVVMNGVPGSAIMNTDTMPLGFACVN
jgi:hypothetical protein